MKDNLHSIIYAAVLGLVCTLLLTGVAIFTEPYREANKQAERIRNILSVLDVPYEKEASSEELVKVFQQYVIESEVDGLTFYGYVPDPKAETTESWAAAFFPKQKKKVLEAMAVEFFGPGYIGKIRGILALEKDIETIRGISFYEQEETPGVGGKIANACKCSADVSPDKCAAKFRHQFRKKLIRDSSGKWGIRILRNQPTAGKNNLLDAITGATNTSSQVESLINATIKKIVTIKERKKDVH